MADVEKQLEAAAEAIEETQEAIAEAKEEAAEEITDAIERAETLSEFDTLNARLNDIEDRLGNNPAASDIAELRSQMSAVIERLDTIANNAGGATADETEDAIESVEEASEELEHAAVPDAVEDAAESVEDATEIEQAPKRMHVLFRRFGNHE